MKGSKWGLLTKFTYKFRWGADPNAFYAYVVSYSVWYMGEGVLHLLGQAPCVVAKIKLQPNNGLNDSNTNHNGSHKIFNYIK